MVYVDNMNAHYGRMIMCHMMADTHDELLARADTIGVARSWIQYAGTASEHFDICKSKRALAVKNGALEVCARDLVLLTRTKRDAIIQSHKESTP